MSKKDNDRSDDTNERSIRPNEILTECYQPQGTDNIPEIVPPLVSGVISVNEALRAKQKSDEP
jgi:hypothetical protein